MSAGASATPTDISHACVSAARDFTSAGEVATSASVADTSVTVASAGRLRHARASKIRVRRRRAFTPGTVAATRSASSSSGPPVNSGSPSRSMTSGVPVAKAGIHCSARSVISSTLIASSVVRNCAHAARSPGRRAASRPTTARSSISSRSTRPRETPACRAGRNGPVIGAPTATAARACSAKRVTM